MTKHCTAVNSATSLPPFNRQSKRNGRELILGVARTGAKFTAHNHHPTGNATLDLIASGGLIPVEPNAVAEELKALASLDVGYFHEHARNPVTAEQSADQSLYRDFAVMVREISPHALISFGGSRNGPEIAAAIAARGERARIEQAEIPIHDGGAEFVTSQAAIELQIVTDMERQGYVRIDATGGRFEVLRDLSGYVPTGTVEKAELEVNSTAGGGNYGSSSAAVQIETLKWSIAVRRKLGLPFEVEWVQQARSAFLTWLLANALSDELRQVGRLNITILFGFSPRLPFPETFAAFRAVVETARSIAPDRIDSPSLRVSVSVGAAVLPQHAPTQVRAMDVGPLRGALLGPMERLVLYAAEPDSGVDIVRVGMEDTPFIIDASGRIVPATNALLVERARRLLDYTGASVVTDPSALHAFAAT